MYAASGGLHSMHSIVVADRRRSSMCAPCILEKFEITNSCRRQFPTAQPHIRRIECENKTNNERTDNEMLIYLIRMNVFVDAGRKKIYMQTRKKTKPSEQKCQTTVAAAPPTILWTKTTPSSSVHACVSLNNFYGIKLKNYCRALFLSVIPLSLVVHVCVSARADNNRMGE